MEKKEAQDLTKAINSLVTVIKEQNKHLDKQNQFMRDNTEAIKELRTRLGSVANAITSGGSVVNP
jgi:chromosome segregation ATPase